jgi:hypothetical protein
MEHVPPILHFAILWIEKDAKWSTPTKQWMLLYFVVDDVRCVEKIQSSVEKMVSTADRPNGWMRK